MLLWIGAMGTVNGIGGAALRMEGVSELYGLRGFRAARSVMLVLGTVDAMGGHGGFSLLTDPRLGDRGGGGRRWIKLDVGRF